MPDFFRDSYGRIRAVRGSPGYERGFEGLSKKEKDYLRDGGKGYTFTADRQSRQERINKAADKTSLHSGARQSPQALQAQLDKMNHNKGLYLQKLY